MFTWLPFFKEMATWILPYRNKQEELCSILRKIGFEGNLMDQNSKGETDLKVMDPLTFFAFFQKSHNLEKRSHFLAEFKKISGLHSPVPTDFNGLPSAQPFNVRFFKYEKDRKGHEMNLLWDLSEQAIKGELKEESFNAVLSMHGIGVAKLTQALFWLNPEKFYPIDSHKNYLDKIDSNLEIHKLSDYKKILEKIKILYPQKMHELSYDAWKNNQNEVATKISDQNDHDTLKQYKPEKYQLYIELIRRIIAHYDLKKTDARIVFSVRPRKLKFIIGQRSCLILYNNKGTTHFGFIAGQKIDPNAEIFNGPTTAYFNYTDSIADLAKYENDIIKAIGPELKRTKQSSHMERDDPDFRNIVFSLDVNLLSSQKNSLSSRLNTILYGPPGTGKTYHSVLMAAEIIENRTIDQYSEALEVFNKNLHDKIEFITFHQNYSYEDFIQGIRPDIENNKTLTFEKKDGIFKTIADRALQNLLASEKQVVHKKEFNTVFEEFIRPLIEGEVEEIEVKMKKVSFFITEVGNKSIDFRKASGGTAHSLSIATLKKMYEAGTVLEIQGLSSYYSPLLEKLLLKGKLSDNQTGSVSKNNYVIVIDEINRANISRVFGELITLIEPDKRSHGQIPLKAKLPSGDEFIVPSNLYIIGTMNTADKSIALLDIALRRRFEFVSMYPKYEVNGLEIYDIDILKSLNEQIINSKGHDFQIGHSYFMKENNDLLQRMNKKVIPLLLEYFMNDDKEVRSILYKAGLDVETDSWPIRIIGRRG